MAELRAEAFALKATTTMVDGATSDNIADARLDGQIVEARFPAIVERSIERSVGTVAPHVSPRGLQTMTFEMDTPSAEGDFRALYGRNVELTVYKSNRLTARASDGSYQFDAEKHVMACRLTGITPGAFVQNEDVVATIAFTLTGEYTISEKAATANQFTVSFKTDVNDYVVQTGSAASANLYENLAASLTG